MGILFIGVLCVLGGFAWAALVVMACGMSSRSTTSADAAPAWIGVAAMGIGVVLIVFGIVDWIGG